MGKLISINPPSDRWAITVCDSDDKDYIDVFYSGRCGAYTVVIHSTTVDNVPALIEQAKPKLERLKKNGTFRRARRNDNA